VHALPHAELTQRYLNLWNNNNRLRLRLAAAFQGVYDKRADVDGGGSFGSFDPTLTATLAVLEARVLELENDNTALVIHNNPI
jgi:hypothetical protein